MQNPLECIELDLKALLKDGVPCPDEVDYWEARNNRTFYLDFEIDDSGFIYDIIKNIIKLNTQELSIPKEELKPIYIYVNSPGGYLDDSFALADVIESSRIPVITIGMGVAMSAGFIIFLSGHRRYAFKHCQFLAHSGSAGFQGTAEQIEEAQKNYKKQIESMKKHILSHTSIDEKTFNKNKSKDWYIVNEDVEKYNIATVITSFDEIK